MRWTVLRQVQDIYPIFVLIITCGKLNKYTFLQLFCNKFTQSRKKPDETAIIFLNKGELFLWISDKNNNYILYRVQTLPLCRGGKKPTKTPKEQKK